MFSDFQSLTLKRPFMAMSLMKWFEIPKTVRISNFEICEAFQVWALINQSINKKYSWNIILTAFSGTYVLHVWLLNICLFAKNIFHAPNPVLVPPSYNWTFINNWSKKWSAFPSSFESGSKSALQHLHEKVLSTLN